MSLRGQLARLFLPTLLLISFALNLQLLDRFPLREDEALYSYWARSLRHDDFLMRAVWPDKPPLFLWAQALVFEGMGSSQAAARLLNVGLTTAAVALIAATGRRLWGNATGTLSALLAALNPFAISFAATAYTDPLLVFCGQLAFYLALHGRGMGAGIWLAAAIMTKQQGVLYLPLVLLTLILYSQRKGWTIMGWLLGMTLVLAPILYWDSLRWAVAPSPWDLSVRNYAPLALAPVAEWWNRLQQWRALLWYFVGSTWVWWGFIFFVGARYIVPLQKIYQNGKVRTGSLLLVPWSVGYLLLHIITTVQIWDRYLLPLVPIFVLLFTQLFHHPFSATHISIPTLSFRRPTRGGIPTWPHGSPSSFLLSITVLTLILLPPAVKATQGAYPVGGDRGAYAGLVETIEWLQQHEEPFVLYHQRLGWHHQFYLFDQLQSGQTDLRWFTNAVYLADNAAKTPYRRRFYIQPTWYTVDDLPLHLATRNLSTVERAHFGEMRLYEIINRPQAPCTWCICKPTLNSDWLQFPTIEQPLIEQPLIEQPLMSRAIPKP